MANRTLPNPSFGNDPTALLGSLIIEIGDLQKDQKETTKRIENLDENEDQSTTKIEKAVEADTEEVRKTTKGIEKLSKIGIANRQAIEKVSKERAEQSAEEHKADMFFHETTKKYMDDLSTVDRFQTGLREGVRELREYFNPENPEGISKSLGNLGTGAMRALTNSTATGAEQFRKGLDNLTDGMGALGPAINAVKTVAGKLRAGFDLLAGGVRIAKDGFSGIKNFFTNFGNPDEPVDKIAKGLEEGTIKIEQESDGEKVELADSVYDKLRSAFGIKADSLLGADERAEDAELEMHKAFMSNEIDIEEEQTKILREIADKTGEEEKKEGGFLRLLLSSLSAIIIGLLFNLFLAFKGFPAGIGAAIRQLLLPRGVNQAGAGAGARSLQRTASSIAGGVAAGGTGGFNLGNTNSPLNQAITGLKTTTLTDFEQATKDAKAIVEEGDRRRGPKTDAYKQAKAFLRGETTSYQTSIFRDQTVEKLGMGERMKAGQKGLYEKALTGLRGVGLVAPYVVGGLDAYFGAMKVSEKLDYLNSLKGQAKDFYEIMPEGVNPEDEMMDPSALFYFPGETFPRPMTLEDEEVIRKIFESERAGEVGGAVTGMAAALGTVNTVLMGAKALQLSSPSLFTPLGGLAFAGTSILAGIAGYAGDRLGQSATEGTVGGLIKGLDADDYQRYESVIEALQAPELEDGTDSMNDEQAMLNIAPSIPGLFNSNQSFVNASETMNVYSRDILDTKLRSSEHVKTVYG